MKRLLILLLIVVTLVGVASATTLNFQNPGDQTSLTYVENLGGVNAGKSWVESTTGLNNYMRFSLGSGGVGYYSYGYLGGAPTTYAAGTLNGKAGYAISKAQIWLLDTNKNSIYVFDFNSGSTGKYEIKISGGVARAYRDGILLSTSTALSQNPTYIGFGAMANGGTSGSSGGADWDDISLSEPNAMIMGLPESVPTT
jgi:hypothetical protein